MQNSQRGPFLQNKCSINFCTVNLLLSSFEQSVERVDPGGLCHSSVSAEAVTSVLSSNAAPLLSLLKLSARQRTRAAKALLQHVGVCWLYPLVVILFCFNDLKAKLLVKIDG